MDGLQQRSSRFPQLVDGVNLQDGVVHHDTASHDDTDGRHQVQRMTEQPQRGQGKGYVNRDFHQHNQRLEEALELGTKDEVHQQDGHEQNHRQFANHLLIGEEATGKVHFPAVRFLHHVLDVVHQFRRIRHFEEVHRNVFTVLACRDALQVFRRNHLHQPVQWHIVHLSLCIRLGLHQGSAQNIVDGLLLSGNAHRQILLVRTERRHLVFLESRTEYTGQLIVCHIVQQKSFPIHHQVHLIAESDAFGRDARPLHDVSFQLLQSQWVRSL